MNTDATDHAPIEDAQGMLAYFREYPGTVEEKADELEDAGHEELAGYIRYRLALAFEERPDPADAEAAGLPMPEDIGIQQEGST